MEEESRLVRVFFYGTFMNPEVLAAYGIAAREVLPAKVTDFELCIRPRVNLVASKGATVYGAIVLVTQKDLEKIYSELERRLGLKYLPEAVLAETLSGGLTVKAALCYIAHSMTPGPAAPEYVKELADCVRALNFPESYALHIESFGR
jgi:hypothetical protein